MNSTPPSELQSRYFRRVVDVVTSDSTHHSPENRNTDYSFIFYSWNSIEVWCARWMVNAIDFIHCGLTVIDLISSINSTDLIWYECVISHLVNSFLILTQCQRSWVYWSSLEATIYRTGIIEKVPKRVQRVIVNRRSCPKRKSFAIAIEGERTMEE